MQRRVLLLGATGLVGRDLLAQLLAADDIAQVVVIVRRTTGVTHPKLDEHVLDLDAMEKRSGLFAVDQIFCALGTTIKVAGSQERFRVVDHDYPLTAARLGRENGARHFLIVTALGASPRSRIFYNRVKGEVERDILALGYPSTTIARPAMLLGERTEVRLGERIAARFSWIVPSIQASDVARALVVLAREDAPGARIVKSRELRAIAATARQR